MSHKIFKEGEFDLSNVRKFDKELEAHKIGTKESQDSRAKKFDINAQHSEMLISFKESQLDAAAIIKNAKKEAETIINLAIKEAEKTRREVFTKGYEEGKQKAVTEARDYVTEAVKDFSNLMKELYVYKEKLIEETERDILKLVIEATNKVILTKLEDDDEIVVRVVKQSVKNLIERETLTIRINPKDAEAMRREKVDIIQEVDGIKKIIIIEDESIKRGGCYIESATSDVDARIDKQLDVIKKVIERK